MNRLASKTLVLLVISVLAGVVAVSTATPAQAANRAVAPNLVGAPCGYTCDQRDPQSYNICGTQCPDNVPVHCSDDAVTKRSAAGPEGPTILELRYSARC